VNRDHLSVDAKSANSNARIHNESHCRRLLVDTTTTSSNQITQSYEHHPSFPNPNDFPPLAACVGIFALGRPVGKALATASSSSSSSISRSFFFCAGPPNEIEVEAAAKGVVDTLVASGLTVEPEAIKLIPFGALLVFVEEAAVGNSYGDTVGSSGRLKKSLRSGLIGPLCAPEEPASSGCRPGAVEGFQLDAIGMLRATGSAEEPG